jgi:hypothetical protein
MQPEILDIFLGELYIVYMGQGAHFCLCGECDVDHLGSAGFYLPFFNEFWIADKLVCCFCEAMALSLSVASTAVSPTKVSVVDSGVVGYKYIFENKQADCGT